MIFVLAAWVACAFLAGWIAAQRGASSLHGFTVGLLFGPLGVLLALVSRPPDPDDEADRP